MMKVKQLILLLTIAAAAISAVDASVFDDVKRWPITTNGTSQGYTIIPICIAAGSSAEEKSGLTIHDQNPSLEDVIGRVRFALSDSWEKYSNVRFVGWKKCDDLTNDQKLTTMGIYINKDAPNNCAVGTASKGEIVGEDACSFKPWGNGNQCISYNAARFVSEYRYSCVEQYAIHEVGHGIGFLHEWMHPLTATECSSTRPDDEQPLNASETSINFSDPASYTVVNPDAYDRNSLMTYDDQCADVSGERFGSPNLSDIDIMGAKEVYPPPNLGTQDVGVILNNEEDCPDGKLVNIFLDNEDGDQNNSNDGWIGAIVQERNTHFKFCRVDGTKLGMLPKPTEGNNHYAVLRLGDSCPSGAFEFSRYHDDQDQPPLSVSWMSGEFGPTEQGLGKGTRLFFCFFPESTSPGIMGLPDYGFEYGVFANEAFGEAAETGRIYIDDENEDNMNELDTMGLTAEQTDLISQVLTANENTEYRLAQAKVKPPTALPTSSPLTGTPTQGPTGLPLLTSLPTVLPTGTETAMPQLELTPMPMVIESPSPTTETLTPVPSPMLTISPTISPQTDPPTAMPTSAPLTGAPTVLPTNAPLTGPLTATPTSVLLTGAPTGLPLFTNLPTAPTQNQCLIQLMSGGGCAQPREGSYRVFLDECDQDYVWRLSYVNLFDGFSLLHSPLDDTKCLRAGLASTMNDGTRMAVVDCKVDDVLQHFHSDGYSIYAANDTNLCMVYRGVLANVGVDPIIMKKCNESQDRRWDEVPLIDSECA
jgi:hypothetical protein